MRLRPANPDDLQLLRRWDEQPHIVAAKANDDWGWEVELARRPDWREQLIAEIDGRPVGFVQIIDPAREDSHYWGDVPANLRAVDLWIGEEAEVEAVLVDPLAANTRAHRFYERLGFRFVERRRFGADDCFVYRLDRAEDYTCNISGHSGR